MWPQMNIPCLPTDEDHLLRMPWVKRQTCFFTWWRLLSGWTKNRLVRRRLCCTKDTGASASKNWCWRLVCGWCSSGSKKTRAGSGSTSKNRRGTRYRGSTRPCSEQIGGSVASPKQWPLCVCPHCSWVCPSTENRALRGREQTSSRWSGSQGGAEEKYKSFTI